MVWRIAAAPRPTYCLLQNPVSNNVGGVKKVFGHTSVCTHRRAPFRSHGWFARFQPRARFESFGSGTRSDPAISSITHCDQDSLLRTPSLTGSGMPNHYIGDLPLTIGISGLSRVRTELVCLAVVAALTPHPVQMHCQLPCHRYLRDLPSTPHGQMDKLAAPLRLTAPRDVRRFPQQETQQHVALLADVSQPPPISAGLFRRNQPDVAGQLLAAGEAVWGSDHQLVSQCRQRANSGMRHQPSRYRALLHFLFQCMRQILDLRRELVE